MVAARAATCSSNHAFHRVGDGLSGNTEEFE
jgi:hypothetical protein